MSENALAAEVVEKEIEDGGESGQLVPMTTDDQLIALEGMAKNAERMIAAKQKIWTACLKITKPGDWTVFGSGDKKKAELGHAGAFRYASFLGISFSNWTAEKVTGSDERGAWYRWDFECDSIFSGRTLRVYGRAGSRDKFFGKQDGAFKELHDVNEGDIKMAARRNAMKEGVKCLMGIHHMDPAELESAGVKMGGAGGYDFKSKEEKAEASLSVTVKVADVTMKDGGSWKKYTVKDVEGVVYNSFSETHAKVAKEAKTADKSVTITYTVTEKYGNEIKGLVSA